MDLRELEQIGQDYTRHWYYRSKTAALGRLIGKGAFTRVLDVGAGSGLFSRYLLENHKVSEAWCVDPHYEQESVENVAGRLLHFRKNPPEVKTDLVIFIDVLEHIVDDEAFLRTYVSKMDAGTTVVISVPAFRFLWSPHDDFLGHERRYSLDELRRLASAAGLRERHRCYFFGLVFPAALLTRILGRFASQRGTKSQLHEHSYFIDRFLGSLCNLELLIMKRNRLWGLSAMWVGAKG